MVDDVPTVQTPYGQRRHWPVKLHADKADDRQANRAEPPSRGVTSRTRDAGSVIGAAGWHHWQIERSLSWLGGAAVTAALGDQDSGGSLRSRWWCA